MFVVPLRCLRFRVNRLDAHRPHQPIDPIFVHTQVLRNRPASVKRVLRYTMRRSAASTPASLLIRRTVRSKTSTGSGLAVRIGDGC